jgi:DNA replication protein DnaC
MCDKHISNVTGQVKPIQTVIYDGITVCPICERDKANEELSAIESEKAYNFIKNENHNMLDAKSVISDVTLLNVTFGSYVAKTSEEIENKQKASDAFKRFKNNEMFNLWLVGAPGVGKSHLAMSILRNLNEGGEKDKSCLFVSVGKMLRLIKNSFNNKESMYTEEYFISLCAKADYLVLDDLGAETGATNTLKSASDYTLQVLYGIADARQGKATILTTNLSTDTLTNMYDAKLVSRFLRSKTVIKFVDTTDKRISDAGF